MRAARLAIPYVFLEIAAGESRHGVLVIAFLDQRPHILEIAALEQRDVFLEIATGESRHGVLEIAVLEQRPHFLVDCGFANMKSRS